MLIYLLCFCSHEIKTHILLGRKVMTNLDRIFKSSDITLTTKVHLVKAMVFPVVLFGCECWIVKKAVCRRIDAFELWCWRRLFRVPWTARNSTRYSQRRSRQSLDKVRILGLAGAEEQQPLENLSRLFFWPSCASSTT